MIKVKEITDSGGASPYQMDFVTDDGKIGYLRYRGGRLSFGFVDVGKIVPDNYIFSEIIGHPLDGYPDDELFKSALRGHLELPEGFSFED